MPRPVSGKIGHDSRGERSKNTGKEWMKQRRVGEGSWRGDCSQGIVTPDLLHWHTGGSHINVVFTKMVEISKTNLQFVLFE